MIRPATFIGIILFSALAYAVFHVEHRVERLRGELITINNSVKQDKEAIHVLEAEWSYLNQPNRLQKMSDEYLSLMQMQGEHIKTIDDIPLKGVSSATPAVIQASEVKLSQR